MGNGVVSVEDRFWPKVDRRSADECWAWLASTSQGYGEISLGGRLVKAHRVAYELLVGPIPVGLVIDHLCRNRACVNPSPMEPVTSGENTLRGEPATRTHCPHGPPYSPENTYHSPNHGRRCRECKRVQDRERDRLAAIRDTPPEKP